MVICVSELDQSGVVNIRLDPSRFTTAVRVRLRAHHTGGVARAARASATSAAYDTAAARAGERPALRSPSAGPATPCSLRSHARLLSTHTHGMERRCISVLLAPCARSRHSASHTSPATRKGAIVTAPSSSSPAAPAPRALLCLLLPAPSLRQCGRGAHTHAQRYTSTSAAVNLVSSPPVRNLLSLAPGGSAYVTPMSW